MNVLNRFQTLVRYLLLIAVVILDLFSIIACNGGGDGNVNQAPTASFTADPTSGTAPLSVDVDASASNDADGNILSYVWDFGDGGTGNGVTSNNTYGNPGSYIINLTVTDNDGATATATETITVYDTDGVADAIEDGAPNDGDGNNDGLPDSQQQNVASLPNIADSQYVTIVSPHGTRLSQVQSIVNPSPGDTPAGAGFPIGLTSFIVQGITSGGSTTVTLLLPPGVLFSTYYMYGPTPDNSAPHWYEFLFDGTTGAEIFTDRILLHFVDGLRGDDDLNADGEITDDGGPFVSRCAAQYALEPLESFQCELPTPTTGDTPVWESSSTFPSGLNLVTSEGKWFIQGTVAQSSPLVSYPLELSLTVAGNLQETRQIIFNIVVPFSVWTQNTLLRPPDLISEVDFALTCGGSILQPWLIEFCEALVAAEGIWDTFVMENTTADNTNRTELLMGPVSGYDIVTLQEVFDGDREDQLVDGLRNYWVLPGPPSTPLSVDPFGQELPNISSGLELIIRKDLAPDLTQIFDVAQRQMLMFEECSGVDCLANKGVTLDVVHFGRNSDHYVFVVNSHTQASLGEEEVRRSQFQQIRNLIDTETDARHPVLIMGDFNVIEHDAGEYNSMLQELELSQQNDLFREFGPQALEQRYTFDPSRNAYAANWFPDDPQQRLDNILVRQGTMYKLEVESIGMTDRPIATTLCNSEGWPINTCYISDHFGLRANLKIVKQEPDFSVTDPADASVHLEGASVYYRTSLGDRTDLWQEVTWTSDIDGVFGTVSNGNWNSLSSGVHNITASVTDFDGLVYSDTITITIIPDDDRDGLSNEDEATYGTDPNNPDHDGDGLLDGEEVHVYMTEPLNPDTDSDGVTDGDEVRFGGNPLIADSDYDGLPDSDELNLGTELANVDSDGDGVWDGVEVILNTNPNSAADIPPRIPGGVLVAAVARGYLALIDPPSGRIGHIGQPAFGFGFGLEFDNTGNLFIAQTTDLATADPLTAVTTDIGPFVTAGDESIDVISLAFYSSDGNIYGVEEGPPPDFLQTGQLLQIDPVTGTTVRMGSPLTATINALTFDQSGALYAAIEAETNSDRLVVLSPATGEIIQDIGLTGFGPVFGLTFDGSGVLLATAINANGIETDLLSIDPATGQGTLVAHFDEAVFDLAVSPAELGSGNACFTVDPEPTSDLLGLEVFDATCSVGTGLEYRWEFSMPDFGYQWCFGADSIIDWDTHSVFPYDCGLPYSFNSGLQLIPFDMGGLPGWRYTTTLIVQDAEGNTDSVTEEYTFQSDGTLACGEVVSGSIGYPGEVDYYDFEGQVGDTVTITATLTEGFYADVSEQWSVAPIIVFSTSGQQQFELPSTGTYIIRVNATDYPDYLTTGPYSFNLNCP